MGRDTIQLEDAVSTISQEYLLEFTSEYGIPESLHPEYGLVQLDQCLNLPRTRSREGSGAMGPLVNKRRRKRGNDEADANVPPKVLRKDHDAFRPAESMSNPDPLSYAKPQPYPERDVAQSSRKTATEIPTENVATTEAQGQIFVKSPESGKSTSFLSVNGSPGGIYQPEWGVTNNYRLDTPDAAVEAEVHGLHNQTKNLEALLEAKVDMKKAAEAKNAELTMKLESLRVQFSDLQVSNNELSQQVSNLQAQLTGEEKIKTTFEEFKKYEDEKVEQRYAEMDARLDKLNVDFDEELYPHMLTAIAGYRWVIRHGLLLAVMKCSESPELRQAFADVVSAELVKGMSEALKYGIEHGKADRDLAAVEAYDPKADSNYVKALQDLKDLKYPLVDQLEGLKDALMELIVASLHLGVVPEKMPPSRSMTFPLASPN
ncbi:hypothetical protein Tco_0936795 [Tanacetum coccineum]|uniref:Transposase (Putative), gypsy type n=1 Tax=Tanacetum coccineum TaxID=301880 RepID=A0ABQ5DCE3_9ASTR